MKKRVLYIILVIITAMSSLIFTSCTDNSEEILTAEQEAEEKLYEKRVLDFAKKNNAIKFPDYSEYKYSAEIQEKFSDKILYDDEIYDFNDIIKIGDTYYGSSYDYVLKIPENLYKTLLKDEIELDAIAFRITGCQFGSNIDSYLDDYIIDGTDKDARVEDAQISTHIYEYDYAIFIGELVDILYSDIVEYDE